MSDTCIVCLGDLSIGIDGVAEQSTSTGAVAKSPTADREVEEAAAADTSAVIKNEPDTKVSEPECDIVIKVEHIPGELIAHLQPCGHDLHNECLKPWVERANSCPICRASFHLVELLQYVGGKQTGRLFMPIIY